MEKLNELIKACKCGVHLTVNGHRDYYEKVQQHISQVNVEDWTDIELNVREKMIELNTIIELQFYPDTPIGFYRIYHYDLETAVNMAIAVLND